MPVRLEQSLVAVFAGVIVRAGYEVEAHGLEVGRHVGCAGEPTRARTCERPAVDDVALVVAGGDVRVADQADHVLKGGCGVLRLRIRDDDVSDRRNGEAVGDRCGELEVIPGLAITGARLLGRHGFPAQNGRRQRHEHKGYKLVALHHGSSPGERFLHVGPSGPIGDNPVMPYRNLERGRGRWGQIGAVAIVVATGVTIAAQQTPPPNPLGQALLDAAGVLRDDAFIRIPLRTGRSTLCGDRRRPDEGPAPGRRRHLAGGPGYRQPLLGPQRRNRRSRGDPGVGRETFPQERSRECPSSGLRPPAAMESRSLGHHLRVGPRDVLAGVGPSAPGRGVDAGGWAHIRARLDRRRERRGLSRS